MKTERKKKKEAKRKNLFAVSNSGPSTYWAIALPLGQMEQTSSLGEILLLKPSSLINVNSKIFFRRTTAVSTVKTQRKCISSHLHVKNGSPTV